MTTLGAFALADLDVGQDLLELIVGGLRADHRLGVQRIALAHRLGADRGQLEELVVDVGLDQARDGHVHTSPWLRANIVNPSSALSWIVVVGGHHIGEEDVGALAAELQGDRDQVLARRTA